VPLLIRDQLALAADCEKRKDLQGAATRYREAIASSPDDLLAPKALVGYGRLLLQALNQPAEALQVLEQAHTHPRATPEFQKVSTDLIAGAKEAIGSAPAPPVTESQAASEPEPEPGPEPEPPPQLSAPEVPTPEEPVEPSPPAPPDRSLAPAPVRAVGIDARGLMLEDRQGRTGHLPWQKVTALSVASIGQPGAVGQDPDALILDLIPASDASPPDGQIRCLRLSLNDLAIPQLQSEPPLRALQRLVATILKAAGATPHPDREACMGLQGFPAFPDLAAYEADLVTRLSVDR
jgi:tetratricopeptide (TPR) repeat protein